MTKRIYKEYQRRARFWERLCLLAMKQGNDTMAQDLSKYALKYHNQMDEMPTCIDIRKK